MDINMKVPNTTKNARRLLFELSTDDFKALTKEEKLVLCKEYEDKLTTEKTKARLVRQKTQQIN